jgi:Spy/CpxP family protein refolding chaperone
MKRGLLVAIAGLALVALAALPLLAQEADDEVEDVEIFIDDGSMLMAGGDMGPEMGRGMGMGDCMSGGGGHGMGMGMMAGLDLTKDQEKQLHGLNIAFRKEMIPLKAQMQVMRIELHELIRADAGRADIDRKIDQISAMRTDIQKRMVGQRLEMRKMLTPDQREKMNAGPQMMRKMIIEKRGAAVKERIGKRHGKGKGL